MSDASTKNLFMVDQKDFAADLIALAAMQDDEIDTSEISETSDFSEARIGEYSNISLRNYDIRSIANWCISKARRDNINVTNLWLNKILYFIYERALRELNTLLTPARAEAWDHGPVFREVYFNFPKHPDTEYYSKYNVSLRKREIAQDSFETEDLQLFEDVWKDYGHLSPSKLRNLSHEEGTSWHAVWTYKGYANPGMVIDTATILGQNTDSKHGNT